MSNFDFLKDFDEILYKLGNRIEKEVSSSPSAVKADATPFLQHILEELLLICGLKYNSRKDFYTQLDSVYRSGKISYGYKQRIYSAYLLRNKIHDDFDEIEKNEFAVALNLHEKLFYIAKKFYRDYNENYDEYKGVPTYKPIELDTSDDEIELVKIPDFSQIVDVKYDYCVICGEPNHSNYSLCCPKCNRIIDNANNFISIRNSFGKDAKFTKEDLIEFGIPEGYANQLINSLVQENMLKVAGRFITFNNMYFDDYIAKIEKYLSVCELITLFREDKITPKEIKQTIEYKQGSFKQDPFYQFYKIIDHEIINKFEKDILTTENIQNSIDYTTITQKQLQRWYKIKLNQYNKGNVNESFVVFNELLMDDYIDLKRQGILEKEIKKQLNISPEVYEFFSSYNKDFAGDIKQINKDLILKALSENKTRAEAIEFAGVTPKEYDDIVKYSDYKGDEFSQQHNMEIETRKERFVEILKENDIETSAELAKITVGDFYKWYDENTTSKFYIDSTKILMDKFLDERRQGKSKLEAINSIGIEEKYVDYWFKRNLPLYNEFKDKNIQVTVDLILEALKDKKSKKEIAQYADISENMLNRYLKLGIRGSEIYRPISEYYENEIIPEKLSKFLKAKKTKSFRKALESSKLSEEELNYYYELGKNDDDRFKDFYEEFLNSKFTTYVYYYVHGKSHNIAMKESGLTNEEYAENKEELEYRIFSIKEILVYEELKNNKTSTQIAKHAFMTVDEIYDWYFRGKNGEEKYVDFYEKFHKGYVKKSVEAIHDAMENKNWHLDNIIRSNKDKFTKKDIEIWVKNGILDNKVISLDNKKEEKNDDEKSISKSEASQMLKEMGIKDYDGKLKNNNFSRSSILNSSKQNTEKLKKQILKKK